MTPDQFSKAKQAFFDIIELDDDQRSHAVALLKAESPELADEVRTLLKNHYSRTIIDGSTANSKLDSTTQRTITHGIQRLHFKLLGGIAPITTAILAAVALASMGWGVQSILQLRLENTTKSHLETLVELEESLLEQWAEAVSLKVESWARDSEVQKAVIELVELSRKEASDESSQRTALLQSDAQLRLERELNKLSGFEWDPADSADQPIPPHEVRQKYALWNRSTITLADWNSRSVPEFVGRGSSDAGASKINRVFSTVPGTESTTIYLPRAMAEERITMNYPMESNRPHVQIITSVRDSRGTAIAAMMIRDQRITDDFEKTINKGRFEATGECYLMDVDGWMMNEPRSIEQLKTNSVFHEYYNQISKRYSIRVADPGGDVLAGYRPTEPIKQWVPTLAARAAADKQLGVNVKGYRDFAGRNVIGGWKWNERIQAMIVVEQSVDEAYQTLSLVDVVNRAAWGVPLIAAIGLAVGSIIRNISRRGRAPDKIGPYRLKEKIGEGGLGVVYRAEHKLLGRPSAIKLLKPKAVGKRSVKRFEREVQLAAKLVHPNAISIYDYGLAEDGSFYYAMEYVEGVNLADFVAYSRGNLALDRVLNILVQTCGAIREAHLQGLVHRDIKPQNIMICYRGGIADVIKVLDYGLVKSFTNPRDDDATQTRIVMGTPKFMAPERLETPWLADPRIDIYSIGTVAYYLMTGRTPILGTTYPSIKESMDEEDSMYKEFASQKPFQEFIRLIASCISPEPAMRPGSVSTAIETLQRVQESFPWRQIDAEHWWADNEKDLFKFSVAERSRIRGKETLDGKLQT